MEQGYLKQDEELLFIGVKQNTVMDRLATARVTSYSGFCAPFPSQAYIAAGKFNGVEIWRLEQIQRSINDEINKVAGKSRQGVPPGHGVAQYSENG
ncbi:hypothetical protein [Streptomyces sp. Go-475]|uniref:hypothetical protein n=1 Tax=Streptomyces sp. Go-475 TaxID=2072505 RepID=UPI000DEFD395|nr:hypothetical protein [Streptomyces sp. Go-475]